MSLNEPQMQALGWIEDSLAGSDPRLASPAGYLEQPQHDFNLTKTRSPGPAAPHPPGLRSEMDGISEDCGVGQAAAVPVQSEPVVSVRGLVKRYGSRNAIAGIDLEVRRREIFAFLGPNGAGKTTTVEILEGFRQRTEGGTGLRPGARPGHGGRRLEGPRGRGLAGVRARARPVRPGAPGHVRRVLSRAARHRRDHRPGRLTIPELVRPTAVPHGRGSRAEGRSAGSCNRDWRFHGVPAVLTPEGGQHGQR